MQPDSSAGKTNTAGAPADRAESGTTDKKGARPTPRGEKIESKAAKARRIARDRKEQKRELERFEKEERRFDEQFRETPFDKLIAKLPIRRPPLYVEQYITDKGHTIYTAVARKRFVCKMSAQQRKKAVAEFYRAANKSFLAGGIKDLAVIVTPLAETIESFPRSRPQKKARSHSRNWDVPPGPAEEIGGLPRGGPALRVAQLVPPPGELRERAHSVRPGGGPTKSSRGAPRQGQSDVPSRRDMRRSGKLDTQILGPYDHPRVSSQNHNAGPSGRGRGRRLLFDPRRRVLARKERDQ